MTRATVDTTITVATTAIHLARARAAMARYFTGAMATAALIGMKQAPGMCSDAGLRRDGSVRLALYRADQR